MQANRRVLDEGRGRRDVARSAVTRLSWSVRLRPLHRDAAAEKATRGTSRGACCELVPQRSVPPHRSIFCYLSRRLLRWRVRCSLVLAKRLPARLPISDCRVCSVRAWCGRVDVLLYRSDVDSKPSTCHYTKTATFLPHDAIRTSALTIHLCF